jgi:hypothetical protein
MDSGHKLQFKEIFEAEVFRRGASPFQICFYFAISRAALEPKDL